jgi:transketolase
MQRIVDISYNEKLSHIGSSLTTYPILDEIYKKKNPNDKVILSCGHAGLSLYVKLEELYGYDAVEMLHDFGIHPHRDSKRGVEVSSGSLGSAVLVACGMALGNPLINVYCVISDGECAEGSVWEALHFANKLKNLIVYVNINGYSAYDTIDTENITQRLKAFLPSINIRFTSSPDVPFLNELKAHYHVLSENDYIILKDIIV